MSFGKEAQINVRYCRGLYMNKFNKFLMPLFILIVFGLVLVASVYTSGLIRNDTLVTIQPLNEPEIWSIYKIEPIDNLYDIEVKSNFGKIRNYSKVNAFGMSAKGLNLAMYKERQLIITNLSADDSSKTDIGLESIRINPGESIYWNSKDSFLTFSIFDLNAKLTQIAVTNVQDRRISLYQFDIPYTENYVEQAYFSSVEQSIVVRTYKKDDVQYPKENGSLPTLYEVPTYLTVLSYDGKVLQNLIISDYSTSQYMKYGFDSKGRVKYLIKDAPIDEFISDEKFIKIKI